MGLFGFDSTIDGAKVILEAADNSAEQMWYRGTQNSEGYFTLQNPVSRKFLTAKSQKITTITGKGIFFSETMFSEMWIQILLPIFREVIT